MFDIFRNFWVRLFLMLSLFGFVPGCGSDPAISLFGIDVLLQQQINQLQTDNESLTLEVERLTAELLLLVTPVINECDDHGHHDHTDHDHHDHADHNHPAPNGQRDDQ